jgi:hypothetical protein
VSYFREPDLSNTHESYASNVTAVSKSNLEDIVSHREQQQQQATPYPAPCPPLRFAVFVGIGNPNKAPTAVRSDVIYLHGHQFQNIFGIFQHTSDLSLENQQIASTESVDLVPV